MNCQAVQLADFYMIQFLLGGSLSQSLVCIYFNKSKSFIEATKASNKCSPFKIAALLLQSKSSYEGNHFLRLQALRFHILHRHFSRILTSDAEELHVTVTQRMASCSTHKFAEQHSRTAFKDKYETGIHYSVRWCSSYEKVLLILHLFSKILFNNKIK